MSHTIRNRPPGSWRPAWQHHGDDFNAFGGRRGREKLAKTLRRSERQEMRTALAADDERPVAPAHRINLRHFERWGSRWWRGKP
jgi:hypothetical protein